MGDTTEHKTPTAPPKASISQVTNQLGRMLSLASGALGFATTGVGFVAQHTAALPRHPANPDPTVFLAFGDPADPAAARYYPLLFKASDFPFVLAPNGLIVTQLGHQWAVFVYAAWEHSFRPRLAEAWGRDLRDVQIEAFGDLRRIRHDIVHNNAVASAAWTGKCTVLHWFKPGELIQINTEQAAEFMEKVRVELRDALPAAAFEPGGNPAL
jgi:hypothetical protein